MSLHFDESSCSPKKNLVSEKTEKWGNILYEILGSGEAVLLVNFSMVSQKGKKKNAQQKGEEQYSKWICKTIIIIDMPSSRGTCRKGKRKFFREKPLWKWRAGQIPHIFACKLQCTTYYSPHRISVILLQLRPSQKHLQQCGCSGHVH